MMTKCDLLFFLVSSPRRSSDRRCSRDFVDSRNLVQPDMHFPRGQTTFNHRVVQRWRYSGRSSHQHCGYTHTHTHTIRQDGQIKVQYTKALFKKLATNPIRLTKIRNMKQTVVRQSANNLNQASQKTENQTRTQNRVAKCKGMLATANKDT